MLSTEFHPQKKIKITDYFMSQNNPANNSQCRMSEQPSQLKEKVSENETHQNQELIELSTILTDENLCDLQSKDKAYILFQCPYEKNKIPVSISSLDPNCLDSIDAVRLPFQFGLFNHEGTQINRWTLIQKLFETKIVALFELEKAIKTYNPTLNCIQFDILRSYVNYQLSEDEHKYFFDQLLPAIIKLALDLPNLISHNIPILGKNQTNTLFLSQYQISSLLANSFLCTYTMKSKDDQRCINFNNLFSTNSSYKERKATKLEKLKCLFNYFRRVTQSKPTGTVSFERKTLTPVPVLETLDEKLSKLTLNLDGCIFQDGIKYSQVDFAHKLIGGGVLESGCVQEEILFVICPELIVAKLFTEKFMDNDSMVITGVEQYNLYTGYANTFKWKSSYTDSLICDKYGRKCRQIIAMDALYFSFRTKLSQYDKSKIDREITKALCAFQPECFLIDKSKLPAIATGNWGCGVYRGDPYLKTLIQLIAASINRRDIVYFTFNNEKLQNDLEQIQLIIESQGNITVGQLYQATLSFARHKQQDLQFDLVDYFRRKFV